MFKLTYLLSNVNFNTWVLLMMAFKFNFQNTNNEASVSTLDKDADVNISADKDLPTGKLSFAAKEIEAKHLEDLDKKQTVLNTICDINLIVVRPSDTTDLAGVTSYSDLVPGVYEGGLKIWECGYDLAEFLCKENIDVKDLNIIELGCGAGLPGLVAAQKGASTVHLQDYNPEVIQDITIPNVQLNEAPNCEFRFFSGDWSSLPSVTRCSRYDLILTAETIYSTENYPKLHKAFDELLTETGVIYLAAKSTYFGVGGTTRLFEDFIKKQGVFTSQVCLEIPAGVPREIIKITRLKT